MWVCLRISAAGDVSQMTIPLIEMTDYSNVQKVIKNPAAVFLPFFLLLLAENISDSKSELEKSALKGDVSFPSFKLMIAIRITCHTDKIQEILF